MSPGRCIAVLIAASAAVAHAAPILLTPGSLLVLQTGFPSGSIEQYSTSGAAGPTLALPPLGDIPESITVLAGQILVGDGSGRVSRIDPSTGAATSVFNTGNVALASLGSSQGNVLALNEFGPPPALPPENTVHVYSSSGVLLNSITLESVPSSARWNGITSDDATIYIADFQSGRVYQYSSSGAALGFFDTNLGAGLSGVSFDSSNGSIWVGDSNTSRVYDFTTGGVLLSDFASALKPANIVVIPSSSTTPEPSSGMLSFCALVVFTGLLLTAKKRGMKRVAFSRFRFRVRSST